MVDILPYPSVIPKNGRRAETFDAFHHISPLRFVSCLRIPLKHGKITVMSGLSRLIALSSYSSKSGTTTGLIEY